jgi:hypothetical protein
MHNSRYKKASSRIAKRHKIRRYAGIFLKIGLPIAFLVGIIFLLRADFLQVKNFEIIGAETVPSQNIKNTAATLIAGNQFFLIPKSNILLLNKEKLATALLADFPRIEKVNVSKQFFGESVKLSLTERKEDFLWCSLQDLPAQVGECFFMTKSGLVFEKSDFPSLTLATTSNSAKTTLDKSTDKIIFSGVLEGNPLMKNFATAEKMQNYLNLINTFKNAKIVVTNVNIESSDKATAKTDVGDIIFDPEGADLPTAAQNAVLLINQIRIKTPSARFQYIDTRFGNKMFYKLI